MDKDNNFDLVDLMKVFLAVFVVAIHAHVQYMDRIGRLAVPYFFIISAYFFFKKYNTVKGEKDRKRMFVGYAKRLLILLGIWELMYVPIIIGSILNRDDVSMGKLIIYFIIGRLPGFGVAWYLIASVIGLGTLLILKKYLNVKLLTLIVIATELAMVATSAYHGVAFNLLGTQGDFGLSSLPFVFLRSWFYLYAGYILSLRKKWLGNRRVMFMLVPMLVLFFIEHSMVETNNFGTGGMGHDETFALPFVAILLAILTTQVKFKIKNARVLRQLSTFIYLSHPALLLVGGALVTVLGIEGANSNAINWIVTTGCVLALYLLLRVFNKRVLDALV